MILDPLKCGGCGNDTHLVYNQRKHSEGRDHYAKIIFECCQCGSRSTISITEPKIMIGDADSDPDVMNGFKSKPHKDHGKGTICGGWDD